ncbi:MAG TPA: ABC transporter ATP-binding protein [Lachnospiraceae bacterium]|nr:ABC transporter ATP-binding protein [Lachnospiraceae bacterium]
MKQIEVCNLSWKPNSNQVLNGIDHILKEGKVYGILGPNGSGKTSLIRHILRLLPVSSGSVRLNGLDLMKYSRDALATNLSFVPQKTSIDADFKVYDIVAMGRSPYQKRFQSLSSGDMEHIERAFTLTRCEHLKERYFNELSGGEAQRVLIARAIAQNTPWLILDEPISNLDIKHQIELMETLKKLNQEQDTTIIAILHDLNLASNYCHEVLLMRNGSVYASGNTNEVLTKENLKEVYDIDFSIEHSSSTGNPYFIPIVSNE